MNQKTKIEWTERTWNPVAGCSLASPGCTNCYAMRTAYRMSKNPKMPQYHGTAKMVNGKPVFTGKLNLAENTLLKPLKYKTPTTYFVNSMSDLFHEDMPDEWIDRVFAVMALCPQHTFQVLTKRADRMRDYMMRCYGRVLDSVSDRFERCWPFEFWQKVGIERFAEAEANVRANWPLPNVWLGVSVEDNKRAEDRIPDLLATRAAVRFISAEPLLGPVNWQRWLPTGRTVTRPDGRVETEPHYYMTMCVSCGWVGSSELCGADYWGDDSDVYCPACQSSGADYEVPSVDWVICGGESGPNARPMHPDWARGLRDQCQASGTAFFFKQWGEWLPVDQMSEDTITGLYHPAPEEHPDASQRCKFDSVCLDADSTRHPTGKAGQFHVMPEGAFAGKKSMSVFKVGKAAAGRLLDGREWNETPEVPNG